MATAETIRREIHFAYTAEISDQPIICDLMREFGHMSFNIIRAHITPREEGYLVLRLEGPENDIQQALDWLKDKGVKSSRLDMRIRRDENLCMHCGMCLALCPTAALRMDGKTRLVHMDADKCAACGLCAKLCPVKAMAAEKAPII